MGWWCKDCSVAVLSGPAPCPKCGTPGPTTRLRESRRGIKASEPIECACHSPKTMKLACQSFPNRLDACGCTCHVDFSQENALIVEREAFQAANPLTEIPGAP